MRRVLVCLAPARVGGAKKPVTIPCRVGVIFWRREYDPMVTVLVKATQSMKTGALVLPRPWTLGDRPSEGPHDFVPTKGLTDVLLSGHVEVPMRPSGEVVPVHVIVRAEGASLAFVVSSSASSRVPLVPPYLVVAGDGVSDVGPRAPRVEPACEGFHFLEGFDYEVFQTAHPRLRSELVRPGSQITIDGITAAPIVVETPALPPRAIIEWSRTNVATDARLKLDTVHIDLDREQVDFTWRGAVPIEGLEPRKAVDRILVGFVSNEDVAQAKSDLPSERYASVYGNLSRGSFGYAWEFEDVVEGREPPPLPHEELEMARFEALGENEAPTSTLTLAEHAQIAAELLEIIGSRGMAAPSLEEQQERFEVLQRHGLDDFTWTIEERAHADRLAAVPSDVNGGIHAEYGRLFVTAQDRLAPPGERLPLARDYATITARLRVENPRDVLADAKMSLGAWMRIDRKWQKKMAEDEAARDEVEGYLDAESAARGEPRVPEVDDEGRFVS